MAAPIDLCVNFLSSTKTIENSIEITKTAIKLGYEGIAINKHVFNLKDFTDKDSNSLKLDQSIISTLPTCQSHKEVRQYTRLTVLLEDDTNTQKLSQRDVLSYDILAVRPTTEKTFKQVCVTLPVDIISLDLTQKLPFPTRRGSINAAIERGVHFEIRYSRMLSDDSARRNIITNAYELCRVCCGKNLIMTSACNKMMELRGPMDVANLTHLFGMDASRGKDSVTTNCNRVLMHAESRRSVKSVVTVDRVDAIEEDWVVEALGSLVAASDGTPGDKVMGSKQSKKKRKLSKCNDVRETSANSKAGAKRTKNEKNNGKLKKKLKR